MSNHLRRQELCPIHHSYFCCNRTAPEKPKPPARVLKPAVQILEDEFYPGGFREECNPRELRRRKHLLIELQHGCCANPACEKEFASYAEAELDHIRIKGMGGAFRDDSVKNLRVLCRSCHRIRHSARGFSSQ